MDAPKVGASSLDALRQVMEDMVAEEQEALKEAQNEENRRT